MKVAINRCYGGFNLSGKACNYLGVHPFYFCHDHKRSDPILIECIESLGHAANGLMAQIEIVEVPDGVSWFIDDYSGIEIVREAHRTWPAGGGVGLNED